MQEIAPFLEPTEKIFSRGHTPGPPPPASAPCLRHAQGCLNPPTLISGSATEFILYENLPLSHQGSRNHTMSISKWDQFTCEKLIRSGSARENWEEGVRILNEYKYNLLIMKQAWTRASWISTKQKQSGSVFCRNTNFVCRLQNFQTFARIWL